MKTNILILNLFFLLNLSFAQTTYLEWALQLGGENYESGNSITTDGQGNVYLTGYFYDTADFDPGNGNTPLVSMGDEDVFIEKLDANGHLVWVQQVGGTGPDIGYDITTDKDGNVYVIGSFVSVVDFDPNEEGDTLTSNGSHDIFIQKLDATGSLLWVKQIGGTGSDIGQSVVVDPVGNVYLTGVFSDTVDFDPGMGEEHLVSEGQQDIFIQKLNADGDLIWVKQVGGDHYEWSRKIMIDQEGNLYITGYFYSTTDFDPGVGENILTSWGLSDAFIQKLDPEGDLMWVKQMGGTNYDFARSVCMDSLGNIYVIGHFQGSSDFDPGNDVTILNAGLYTDVFVQKLNSDGDLVWVKQMEGSTNYDYGNAITCDMYGSVYAIGVFKDVVDFDPNQGNTPLSSLGTNDVFIQKLSADGELLWVNQVGGTSGDEGMSIEVDELGNVYTTGLFSETVDFDPSSTNVQNLTAFGACDVFVQKLSQKDLVNAPKTHASEMLLYPNPTDGHFTLQFVNPTQVNEVVIYDTQGHIVHSLKNNVTKNMEFDLTSGLYLIQVMLPDETKQIKLVVN